jgi:hypothetical protein
VILIVAFGLGFWFGWRRAAARGGSTADRVQYGFAHGLAALVATAVGALLLGFFGLSPL